MDSDKDKGRPALREGEVAGDLARLKNWSNFEETAYRDFSQQRAERRSVAHRRIEENRKALLPVPAPAAPGPEHGTSEPAAVLSAAVANVPLLTNPAIVSKPEPAVAPRLDAVAQRLAFPPVAEAKAAVAVFSLAGGAGKSTLCAHLARSLYTRGERVLLVNASGHSLLSLYFGSDEEREGLRQFCAPGEAHASILLYHREHQDLAWLRGDVAPLMQNVDRTIFDLGSGPPEFITSILGLCQLILVPVSPSPQTIMMVKRLLALVDRHRAELPGKLQLCFIPNQFDEEREQDRLLKRALETLCGDALAPMTLSASDEVHLAFEERMTLGDYHPSAPLAQQFERLAGWLRKTLPPSLPTQARRWSEM